MPVWINIRTTSIPDLPCMEAVLNGVPLDEDRKPTGGLNQGFFLRSFVLSSDGKTLLNPQPRAVFAYAQVNAPEYLEQLERALLHFDLLKLPAPVTGP